MWEQDSFSWVGFLCEYGNGVRNQNKRALKASRAWLSSRVCERGHKRRLSGGPHSCFSVSNGTKNMLPGCCGHLHFTHASKFPLRSEESVCWVVPFLITLLLLLQPPWEATTAFLFY